MTKLQVLFVDDEPHVLEGLQRTLREMRHEWDMRFVESGAKALEALAQKAADVVVSDMKMPVMTGADLLLQVQRSHPQAIRFILSGHADADLIHRTVGPAHQFLAKPCDPAELKLAVRRTAALRTLLSDDRLLQTVTRIDRLPSLPSLYLELMQEIRSPNCSFGRVGKIISKDVAMTVKILQLVNSSFFGIGRRVAGIADAISLLGLGTIHSLVLSSQAFSLFEPAKCPGVPIDWLWRHSAFVSAYARKIAEMEKGNAALVNEAVMAGFLHDIGILILATSGKGMTYDDVVANAKEKRITLEQAERELFGCAHAEAGAYLLGLWGFTHSIVEAVAFHARPTDCVMKSMGALTAVHVADALAYESDPYQGVVSDNRTDAVYLEGLGLGKRVGAWREACSSLGAEGDPP